MKKTFKFIPFSAVAIGLLVFSACNDDDAGSSNVITGDSVWKSDQEALATANAVFPPLQRLSSSYSFLLESATESTISFEGPDDQAGPLVSLFKTDINNWYPTKIFNYLYVSIGEANRTVEKADSSHVTDNLSKASIDLARARAKFVRGLDYLYLAQLWGEVPLVLSTNPSSAERTTRKSIDDVYAQIVKDLTDAEADLPGYDQIRSNPSKGAANAILARAYLTWASKPLAQADVIEVVNSRTDPHGPHWDEAKLLKAVEYANKVINSGNYQLESDFESNFGVAAENRSVEHIFTIHHDGDNQGDAQGNHQTHCPFTFRFDLYQDNHIGPADVTLLDKFSNSDKRKRFSILTHLYNQDEPLVASPAKAEDYKGYDYVFPVTSPRIGKYIHRNAKFPEVAPGSESGQPNNIDRIEIRYAEVLLIKAEALFYLNKKSEATPLINELRQRAGLNTYTTITQDNLENEWYLELFFEQKHWLNLVRWHKLIQSVLTVQDFEYFKDDYKDVASIAAKFGAETSTTNYPFFAKIYKHLHSKYDNVNGRFYRFPIPKGLSGNDLGIEQNPGY
ncbi:MAG: RagB/SusD family nutrient uptake outer membrane protein [Dysgonomonas sp.]